MLHVPLINQLAAKCTLHQRRSRVLCHGPNKFKCHRHTLLGKDLFCLHPNCVTSNRIQKLVAFPCEPLAKEVFHLWAERLHHLALHKTSLDKKAHMV